MSARVEQLPTIAEMWAGFALAVLPPYASIHQREDMRCAFYAGATVILKTSLMLADIEDEAECIAALERYHVEADGFRDAIEARAAVMRIYRESEKDEGESS